MAIKTRLTTKGFDEYLEKVTLAGQNIDDAADEALRAGGEILANGMHERVPKDTGNLDQYIGCTEPKADGNFHYVDVGVLKPDGDTARYANVQEFGSANTPAQPYIRPTLDHDMAAARKAMREVFKDQGAL